MEAQVGRSKGHLRWQQKGAEFRLVVQPSMRTALFCLQVEIRDPGFVVSSHPSFCRYEYLQVLNLFCHSILNDFCLQLLYVSFYM